MKSYETIAAMITQQHVDTMIDKLMSCRKNKYSLSTYAS